MQHTCTVCDGTFESSHHKSKYCSNRCSAKASYQNRKASGTYRTKRRLHTRECKRCDAKFEGVASARYCTQSCALADLNEVQLARRIQRRLPVLHVGPTATVIEPDAVTGKGIWTAGECRACGSPFVSQHADITCSAECRAAHQHSRLRTKGHRHRARQRDAFVADVDSAEVFKRDGYRCHLCRKKTDPTQRAPHPQSPTIDHVIPLAKGGTHEPLNCRTACFLCNCTKRDAGGGEQMLLIA